MSEPIYALENTPGPHIERVAYTYEELLELFSDDYNLVKPLVLRCQEYEAAIRALADFWPAERWATLSTICAKHPCIDAIRTAEQGARQ